MCSALIGMIIIVMCIFIPPKGEISASVLAAVGELMTFSGALVSISTNSKIKSLEIEERYKEFEEKIKIIEQGQKINENKNEEGIID